jgi:hypothetical protein
MARRGSAANSSRAVRHLGAESSTRMKTKASEEITNEELSARLEEIYVKKLDETIAELVAAGKPSDRTSGRTAMYQKLDPGEVVAFFQTVEGEWVYSTAGMCLELVSNGLQIPGSVGK